MSDDEPPVDPAVLDIARVAEQLLVVAEALSAIHGAEAVRHALAVALCEFAARTLGEQGMRDEARVLIARLTEDPVIEVAIKWLH